MLPNYVDKPQSRPKKITPVQGYGPRPLKSGQRIGKHILLVDDEQMLAIMCKKTLTKVGFDVTAVTDPEEALKRFKSEPYKYDVVITDKTMPCLDGYNLARQILKIRPKVPIVITSGYEDERINNSNDGISAYAKKPISIADLVCIIDSVLMSSSDY